tara:strand:- start:1455 stop:2264 length:810 start_codon:yes stop_codon:yes gene_type:complete
MRLLSAKSRGFTLVELVTVIVILGIVATSITSFLRFGTQSYTDAADRDALISTARFSLERLSREVRNALPNSIRTIGNNAQCLEFTPIDQSVIYVDIPVAPEAASNSIEVLMLEDSLQATTKYVSIYALNTADIYTKTPGVVAEFSSLDNAGDKQTPSTINFTNNILFVAESPTKRLFFIDEPVSYCIESEQLRRYKGYNGYDTNGKPNNGGVLMAEDLENFSAAGRVVPFETLPSTLQRNAMVIVRFKFVRNDEEINFSHEIQVPNVP